MWITNRSMRMSALWMVLLMAMATVLLIATNNPAVAKKSAKEWAALTKKLHEIEQKEREEMSKTLGNDVPTDKPGMVFAHFAPGQTKEYLDKVAGKYSGQLQSAGVKVSIFETGKDQWVFATFRTKDTYDVVRYLREQPEVMKATLDTSDYWNLPKYQKEFDHEVEEKKKKGEKPPVNLPNPEPPLDEAAKKKLMDELLAQVRSQQTKESKKENSDKTEL